MREQCCIAIAQAFWRFARGLVPSEKSFYLCRSTDLSCSVDELSWLASCLIYACKICWFVLDQWWTFLQTDTLPKTRKLMFALEYTKMYTCKHDHHKSLASYSTSSETSISTLMSRFIERTSQRTLWQSKMYCKHAIYTQIVGLLVES